ncbi:hypothetical protein [Cytophaga aurantiaca]|uniref:hypothetical protein n=1 Tax=Cytophaga aurantiaca TaxID=29530 RepID=UPI0003646FDF|nr:hypothetical protein [Cytophaga aurantiaca]
MNDLFFWLQWKSSYKAFYVALLILFFASIAAVGIAYAYGDLYTIGWDSTGEWKSLALSLDTFTINQFEIPQESEQFLLLKRYTSNDVSIHPWISYTFLAVVLIAFVCFLMVISYLDLWMYILGMALFLFFIVSMNTELLGIFGLYNRLPTVAIILIYGGLTYYFNAFGKNIGLFTRLLALTAATILIVSSMYFFSTVNAPLLYVSHYAITIPIIVCILFMFIVGYDILQFVVVLTSYGKSDFKPKGNSIWSFIAIGSLYIANLYCVYYKPAFIKDMGLLLVQPLVVLIISGILGIWMFEMKQSVKDSIPFKPLGAILYLVLGIITFTTIAFGYATANDALITTLEYCALYIQIGMGLAIFVYVISNFWTKYKKQEEVYKQFYVTYQVPFFVARSLGWAIIMYFVFATNRFVFSSSKAAYYNNIADVYLYTEQDELAESFYKEAWSHEFQNQRSSYSLSKFYEQRDNKIQAFQYYESSLTKNPTPYAYANISAFYLDNNQLFPAMFMLQDGLKVYPNDPHLLNNLGYLYTKFATSDSAVYFFNKAATHTEDDLPSSNLLVYFGSRGKFEECATILKNEKPTASDTYLGNKIAIATLQGKSASAALPEHFISDTLLTADAFTYLYNYTFNKLSVTDTVLDAMLQRFSTYPSNEHYRGDLLYAKATHLYFSKTNVGQALELLQQIIDEEHAPLYIITLANWQLKSGLYEQAYTTYSLLISHPDQRLVAYKCLAAAEYGNAKDVTPFIEALTKSLRPEIAEMAKTLQASMQQPSVANYTSLSDQQKVQCLHYHTLSTGEFSSFKNNIQDPIQSVLLDIERIKQLNNQHQYEAAMVVWNAMKKSNDVSEEIIAQANLEKLKIINGLKQWDVLATELKSTVLLAQDLGYIDYFTARSLEFGKDSAQALSYYQKAINSVGYDVNVQIDYSNYIARTTGEFEAAEKLVAAKRFISYSKPLSLAYIDACLRLGLFKSAEVELNEIQSKLSDSEIAAIKSRFFATPVE